MRQAAESNRFNDQLRLISDEKTTFERVANETLREKQLEIESLFKVRSLLFFFPIFTKLLFSFFQTVNEYREFQLQMNDLKSQLDQERSLKTNMFWEASRNLDEKNAEIDRLNNVN